MSVVSFAARRTILAVDDERDLKFGLFSLIAPGSTGRLEDPKSSLFSSSEANESGSEVKRLSALRGTLKRDGSFEIKLFAHLWIPEREGLKHLSLAKVGN